MPLKALSALNFIAFSNLVSVSTLNSLSSTIKIGVHEQFLGIFLLNILSANCVLVALLFTVYYFKKSGFLAPRVECLRLIKEVSL